MSNQIQSLHPRVDKILEFIKILRVEPFTFVMLFQHGLKGMPNFLLIQDKICMQWYNTTYDYCRDLPTIQEESSGPGLYKTRILSDAIQMATYTTYVQLFPSLIYGVLIGAWIDQFSRGRKWLLIIFSIAGMIENLLLIGSAVKFDASPYINVFMTLPTLLLTGGSIGPRVAVTHYMTATTPPQMMAIRFMIFEICAFLALPIGYALAGYIVVKSPAFFTGQTHNYIVIYIISLAIEVAALLWLIFMVNERIALKHQKVVEVKLQERCKNDVTDSDTGKPITHQTDGNVHPLKMLFNLENARSMMRTLFKRRPNKGKKQILLAILALSILFGEQIALGSLNSQFIQRVYYWSPDYTAYMSAIGMLTGSLGTMAIIPIMTRIFKVWDISLAIVGFSVNLASNLIKGCWLSENAYYLAMGVSSVGGIASICIRSHAAKIVDRGEQGKLMAVMAIADTISPVIATTLLSQIFRVTVEEYPGTVYNVIAGLILIPFCSMIWIYFCTERQAVDGVNNEESNGKHELSGLLETRI